MRALLLTVILCILVGAVIHYSGVSNPLSHPQNQFSWLMVEPPADKDTMKDRHTNPVAATSILLTFSFMLFLPFWPGLRESLWPQDKYPLPIEMKYSKNPRYLSNSFRQILLQSLEPDPVSEAIRTVYLSKEEVVEIKTACHVKTDETIAHTLLVREGMHTEQQVKIYNDLYVLGSANIGSQNVLRTLACDGDIAVGNDTRVIRWIDALGKINVGSGCDLGASCSTVNCLALQHDVRFRRLFGNPVVTEGYVERLHSIESINTEAAVPAAKIKTIEDVTYYRRKSCLLPSGTTINQNVIVKGDLNLSDNVTVNGDIRCEGRTTIGKASVIRGNLFSEGPVDVLEDAVVTGNVFSQDAIRLFPGTCIGKVGCTNSVIAKKKITLDRNVIIYGYLLTEGEGLVL